MKTTTNFLKFNLVLIALCISFSGCGQKSEKSEEARKKKMVEDAKIAAAVAANKPKNDSIRFDKYLAKMQGTWFFNQTQPCTKVSNDKYGLNETNGAAGICLKMKIVITGRTYKAYLIDFALKNTDEALVQDNATYKIKTVKLNQVPELGIGLPTCEGKIELMNFPVENPDQVLVVCLKGYNTVCTEFGGSNNGDGNRLYWDDKKGALHWDYFKQSKCSFSGFCEKLK